MKDIKQMYAANHYMDSMWELYIQKEVATPAVKTSGRTTPRITIVAEKNTPK